MSEKGHRVYRKKVGNLFFETWENPIEGTDRVFRNYTLGRSLGKKEGEEFAEQVRVRLWSKDELDLLKTWIDYELSLE